MFCAPGAVLAKALHRGTRNIAFIASAGFVFSLAVFAVVAWPCLWLQVDVSKFWIALACVWPLFLGGASWMLASSSRGRAAAPTEEEEAASSGGAAAEPSYGRSGSLVGSLVLALYLGWGVVLASWLVSLVKPGQAWPTPELGSLGVLLLTGLVAVPELRRLDRGLPGPSPDDPPPRFWTLSAFACIAALMVGEALNARPDWDDAFYLACVQRYSEGGPLNREDASLPGEGLPPNPHMWLLAWELFGAALCRFSGVHPMISHRTLLPPVLLLMVAAVHWEILGRWLVPKRLVPLAVVGLCAYWTFGNSSYESAGNYLLTKLWQGKSVLWQLGIPVAVLSIREFVRRPSARAWLGCALAATACLAMSTSAVYLLLAVVFALCASLFLWGGLGRNLFVYAAAAASAFPVVPYALAFKSKLAHHPFAAVKLERHNWFNALYWGCVEYGATEYVWIVALPILVALLRSRSARAYLVGVPVVLAATLVNPLAYELVAGNLTSYWTYLRLFWLFPVGLGLAAATALVSDLWSRALAAGPKTQDVCRWILTLACAASIALWPGRFVWSSGNEGPYPGLRPAWGRNMYKIPSDLLPILHRLARTEWGEGRLLFAEHLSQYFVPYGLKARFVCSRASYTIEGFAAVGRPLEGHERTSLAVNVCEFQGTAPAFLDPGMVDIGVESERVEKLLDKYQVRAIVVDGPSPPVQRRLRALGYALTLESGPYQLWER